jgi:lysophospholipase L1-like esterase
LQPKRAALLGLLCFAGTALLAQNPANADKNTRYLALGESITFGYNPTVPIALSNYHGYPEYVSDALNEKVANASCVGETSTSFLKLGVPDLGCSEWKAANLPMYINYTGTQLNYAISYLKTNPNVKLVTINIGGTDLGLVQVACAGNANPVNCELSALPQTLATYGENLFNIFLKIRGTGYRGPIVLLTYYAFNYADNTTPDNEAFELLNGIASGVTWAFGGKVADGFKAFFEATIPYGGDSCKAGLLVPLPGGTCDVHPSIAGQKLLANTVLKALGN